MDPLPVLTAANRQLGREASIPQMLVELFYLPFYAPDHNPSEYLNNDLKQQLRQQPQSGSEQELVERTRSVLRVIQRSPERVRAYFRPEAVRYAA